VAFNLSGIGVIGNRNSDHSILENQIMKTYLQNVTLFAPGHALHLKTTHALIDNGHLIASGKDVSAEDCDQIIKAKGQFLCAGLTDMRASIGEPGHESRETLLSAMKAAMHGGYARVAVVPSSNPNPDSKAIIQQIQEYNTPEFEFLPYANLSKGSEGKQLTEFHELKHAGAIGFTDDVTTGSTELMMRALEYSKQVEGKIFSFAHDPGVHPKAQMHEGITSTKMGLKGSSHHSESIRVFRDLSLASYTEAPLHFFSISTAESIDLIRKAKKNGQQVTCSVAAHQLSFLDKDLRDFDSNKKVWPPFRDLRHKKAIIKGILDGTIDAIESQHTPLEIEHKELEFEYAEFGMNTIQHALLIAYTAMKEELSVEKILELFTSGPSKCLQIENTKPEQACFLFNPDGITEVLANQWYSKSKNSPFLGHGLQGSLRLL
jgi:dihydroorotase